MSKEARIFLPKILWYIATWTVVAVFLFVFLRYRYHKLYSAEKYEALITSVSKRRIPAADPCQYSIFGDPITSEGIFAKVIFYCDKKTVAVNSLDLTVLPSDSYTALLAETGRINGFSVEPMLGSESGWKCFDDHIRISDFGVKIKVRSKVECFDNYSEAEIKAFYAKN